MNNPFGHIKAKSERPRGFKAQEKSSWLKIDISFDDFFAKMFVLISFFQRGIIRWYFNDFQKVDFFGGAGAGPPGRRGKYFFFQNVSPKVLIYSRKKTGAKNVFFATFYVRLYPVGLIPPPQ